MSPPSNKESLLPDGIRKWAQECTVLLVLAALFVALFFPVLFEGKTFFFRDMLHFGYPFKHFIWESFKEGALPFWNEQISGGVPFLSLYHPGVFYPPNLIFLLDDFGNAFNIYFLFHHVVLISSVYRLARFWNLSPEASLGSSVTALLSGYFLSLASLYNHFQTVVWFPLIILCFHRFLLTKSLKNFLATVLLFSFVLLGGSPETCVLIAILSWGYSVLVVNKNSTDTSFVTRTAMFSGIMILGLGIAAIQLVPTEALMKESMRSSGVSFEESSRMSLSPAALSAVILPENHFGFMETTKAHKSYFFQSCFMGLVPLGLLLAGLFSGVKCRAFWFWGVLFFVGIFFSLGKFNPLYSWFYDWVPAINLFRFPEKFFFISAFSLVFLVGLGLDALGAANVEKRIRSIPSFLAVFVLLVLLMWVVVLEPGREWVTGLITLFMLTVILTTATKSTQGKTLLRIFAISLLILELWARNAFLLPMIDRSFYENSPELLSEIDELQSPYRVYAGRLLDSGQLPTANQFPERKNLMDSHFAVKNLLRPNLGMIYGLNYADGLTGLELRAGWLWTELFIKSPPEKRVRILQRSNVRYWVNDNYRSGLPEGAVKIEKFSSALPRAFLVNVGLRGQAPHLLNTYYDPLFNPLKEVLLSEDTTWLRKENFSGKVERIEYLPNRVRIETNQNSEGMLVLMDSYFPGWQVTVDGQRDHIFRANYFYRGVQLSSGPHVIEFSYTPEGFHIGLRITVLTLMVLVMGPIFYRFRNFRW
jgi:hypothetical protein